MEYTWRKPDDLLNAWMNGKYHGQRPPLRDFGLMRDGARHETTYFTSDHAEARRRQAFFNACYWCDPEVCIWPEFGQELIKLNLKRMYDRGTISTEVAGLLISQRNRSVGDWEARARWMRRRGKDPMKRRRYVRSQQQVFEAIAQARKLAEQRRFVRMAREAVGAGGNL